jgi:very-short-patch-repair endonuclease
LFIITESSFHKQGKGQHHFKRAGERMFAGASDTLFKRAAELRSHLTHAEEILWIYLKTKPLGFKFRRQHPFLNYILDFYCHQLKFVIEVDGPIHQKQEIKKNDEEREGHLKDHGLSILRFTNEELIAKPEDVISRIERHLALNTKPKIAQPDNPKSPL